jgi:hypothetical protein
MQPHRHIPPVSLPAFKPAPRQRHRHDGWTAQRQRDFIAALADTGSVTHAAARVGMSTEGAYMLRRAKGAEEFAAAWLAALDHGIARLEDIALERAVHGVEVPIYSYGKLIGTRIVHNDRLLMFMLRNRAMDRFPAGATKAGLGHAAQLRAEAEAANRPGMDEIKKGILKKIEAIAAQERRMGKIGVGLEGQEAIDFENWRAERAERLGLPPPERQLPPLDRIGWRGRSKLYKDE